jgi:phage FluMu protein Com
MGTFKKLNCDTCNRIVEKVDVKAVKVKCWRCVSKMVKGPEIKSIVKSDKPRGWKFMKEYVHTDGTVYHKGIEQPELKDTLPVSVIEIKEDKKKLSKQDKEQLKVNLGTEIQKLKALMFNENRKTKRAELQRSIQKLNRQLSKLK